MAFIENAIGDLSAINYQQQKNDFLKQSWEWGNRRQTANVLFAGICAATKYSYKDTAA